MRSTVGNYYNLFSEDGTDNLGLKVKFDIMIVFPESFYGDPDVWDTLELMLEGRLRGLGLENPYAKKHEVEDAVKKVLESLDYEYERVLVSQALSCENLVKGG